MKHKIVIGTVRKSEIKILEKERAVVLPKMVSMDQHLNSWEKKPFSGLNQKSQIPESLEKQTLDTAKKREKQTDQSAGIFSGLFRKLNVSDEDLGMFKREYLLGTKLDQSHIEAVNLVLEQKQVLACLSTHQKNLVYKIAALNLNGPCIVMNHHSLMLESLSNYLDLIQVPYKKSKSSSQERTEIDPSVKFVLIHLNSEDCSILSALTALNSKINFSLIVHEESQNILQYTGVFLKVFKSAKTIIQEFSSAKVLCMSSPLVINDIKVVTETLGIQPTVYKSSLRANVNMKVFFSTDGDNFIHEIIEEHYKDLTGIVFVKDAEGSRILTDILRCRGITVSHIAGDTKNRQNAMNEWRTGGTHVFVTTTPVSLGVLNERVRFVIRYGIPSSLQSCIYDIGDWGNHLDTLDYVIVYDLNKRTNLLYFIEKGNDVSTQCELQQAYESIGFIYTRTCRRKRISKVFGFECEECKEFCDNCVNREQEFEERECFREAEMVYGLVRENPNLTHMALMEKLRNGILENFESLDELVNQMLACGILIEKPKNRAKNTEFGVIINECVYKEQLSSVTVFKPKEKIEEENEDFELSDCEIEVLRNRIAEENSKSSLGIMPEEITIIAKSRKSNRRKIKCVIEEFLKDKKNGKFYFLSQLPKIRKNKFSHTEDDCIKKKFK